MKKSMRGLFLLSFATFAALAADAALESARNRQDRAALEKAGSDRAKAARNAAGHYDTALAYSYLSEVALELRDKRQARSAAELGISAAKAALKLEPNNAEYHRLLGTLCGQVIPADPMAGFQHGRCAKEEIEKALQMNPKSALAWLSSGVGKFYLPAMFGGGVDLAMKDFQKAAALDPKLPEAWLWIGLAHRKGNRNADARQALQKAKSLNPSRLWIQQQLEKTPAQ
jgi:tetratricopeptide (TPR) repeat protein